MPTWTTPTIRRVKSLGLACLALAVAITAAGADELELLLNPKLDPAELATKPTGDAVADAINFDWRGKPDEALIISGRLSDGPFRFFARPFDPAGLGGATLRAEGTISGSWNIGYDCHYADLSGEANDPDPITRAMVAVAAARAKELFCPTTRGEPDIF